MGARAVRESSRAAKNEAIHWPPSHRSIEWLAARTADPAPSMRLRTCLGLQIAAVHELEAEPSLDAKVAVGDLDIKGRGYLHDSVILNVKRERAAHAAIGADGVGLGLPRLVPLVLPAQLVLAAEHQGPGRTDADAVAAIDARGIGQRNIAFRRDPGVEAPARDRDREGVLGVGAARLDALVAEDALPVVANIQVVVNLHRLGNRLGGGPVGRVMMARLAAVALRRPCRRLRLPVALGARAVLRRVCLGLGSGREIHG